MYNEIFRTQQYATNISRGSAEELCAENRTKDEQKVTKRTKLILKEKNSHTEDTPS